MSLYVIIRLYSKRGSESIHSSESERAKESSVTDLFCKSEEDRELKKMQFLYIDVTLRAFERGKLLCFINFSPDKSQKCDNLPILWRQRMPSAIKLGLHLTL